MDTEIAIESGWMKTTQREKRRVLHRVAGKRDAEHLHEALMNNETDVVDGRRLSALQMTARRLLKVHTDIRIRRSSRMTWDCSAKHLTKRNDSELSKPSRYSTICIYICVCINSVYVALASALSFNNNKRRRILRWRVDCTADFRWLHANLTVDPIAKDTVNK